MVTVRLYAAAASAAGADEVAVPAAGLAEVLRAVGERAPDTPRWESVLARCSLLVDGLAAAVPSAGESGAALAGGTVVDVLPPFAGG